MGGVGCGRVGARTVREDCYVLSAGRVTRGVPGGPGVYRGALLWGDGEPHSPDLDLLAVGYELTAHGSFSANLLLAYEGVEGPVCYVVPTIGMPLPRGGRHWYFLCPLVPGDGSGRPCHRRADRLYLPEGGTYFGCRRCRNLTYASSNGRRKHPDPLMIRMLAADAAVPAVVASQWLAEQG